MIVPHAESRIAIIDGDSPPDGFVGEIDEPEKASAQL